MTSAIQKTTAVELPIVNPVTFIVATRDSGYRSLASAIAELVDNSIEAQAKTVEIVADLLPKSDDWRIAVLDDGKGLTVEQLVHALQFGGTHRFNSRNGLGRFGMGLPNASLSQARCIDIYSWGQRRAFSATLDVDAVVTGKQSGLTVRRLTQLPPWLSEYSDSFTTAVVWSRCDRVTYLRASALSRVIKGELGRIYRHVLVRGLRLSVNGSSIIPIDPVRLSPAPDDHSVELLPSLTVPFANGEGTASISVQFAILPLEHWSHLTNAVKRDYRITKWSGVSVLRESREIAYGWHFMGTKRRENYDDWWRCEIRFPAALDEAFGVTHNKQGVRPSRELLEALVPIVAAQAYRLNRQVRLRFEALRSGARVAERRATDRDNRVHSTTRLARGRRPARTVEGHRYRIAEEESDSLSFMRAVTKRSVTTVYLNRLHPFFTHLYGPVANGKSTELSTAMNAFLLAVGRATSKAPRTAILEFIRRVSDYSAVFMERR